MNYRQALAEFKASFWRERLASTGGNVTRTAREAGVARPWLHLELTKHGLKGRGPLKGTAPRRDPKHSPGPVYAHSSVRR